MTGDSASSQFGNAFSGAIFLALGFTFECCVDRLFFLIISEVTSNGKYTNDSLSFPRGFGALFCFFVSVTATEQRIFVG